MLERKSAGSSPGRVNSLSTAMVVPALILCILGTFYGCSEPRLYVVTDEPTATSVMGAPLSEEDAQTLSASENEARLKIAAGDLPGAIEEYKKQLSILPEHNVVPFKIATVYAQTADPEESLNWLAKSVDNGFANMGKLDNDPALEVLHGEKRMIQLYRQTRETMMALQGRIIRDQWSGPEKPIESYESLQALIAHFDHQKSLLELLKDVFLPREVTLRIQMNDRLEADSIQRYLEEHPAADDIEDAQLELLKIYQRYIQGPLGSEIAQNRLENGCRSYLERFPQGRHLAAVRYIQSEYHFINGMRRLSLSRSDEISRLVAEFRADLEDIVATSSGHPVAGQALVWLAELHTGTLYGNRDLDKARQCFTQLRNSYFEFPEVEKLAESRIFPLWLLTDGLPSFQLSDTNGNPLTPERFAGNVLLLDFWSTSSRAAQEELSNLKWIYEKYKPQGLEILGVSLDHAQRMPHQDFIKWLEINGITWPQYYDGKGQHNELAQLCRVASIPFTVLVDSTGKVVDVGLAGKDLEQALGELIN